MNESFDRKIRSSAEAYKPEPNLKWEEVESRMGRQKRNKTAWNSKYIAIAATIALLISTVMIYFWTSPPVNNDLFASADTIEELDDRATMSNSYGNYKVKEIYRAYAQAGLIQENSSLNGWR